MPIIPIESIADLRVADYAQVREAELRTNRYDAPGGLFVAEGELVVRRLLGSRYKTRSILTTHARLRTLADLVERLPQDTPVYVVDQATMNGVVGFNIHRGVLAIGERGPEPNVSELLRSSRCVVLLEDLTNHDNVGGIFRNVAGLGAGCFGETAVLLSPRCADPLYRKSIRVSMGAALQVPFAWLSDLKNGVEQMRAGGYTIAAMTPSESAVEIGVFSTQMGPKSSKIAILLGSEGPGLTTEAIGVSDVHVRIDMPGRVADKAGCDQSLIDAAGTGTNEGVDSLNVSVACAIALHRLYSVSSGKDI